MKEPQRAPEPFSPDGFNPYLKWLGIPPEQQPPNHYTLLGIPQFESDREVIQNAAYQGVPFDCFSLRYRGYLRPRTPGAYKLFVTSDDGVRVWIRERLMLDEWKDQWAPTFSTDYIDLLSEPVPIKIEFYEAQGQAELRLYWKRRGESEKEVIPKEALFHRP